ncbi:RICIN domain-containing protein [Paractinoplanes maris]|nr:RICIN domain-containing protein [Actinoplanes maris]
MSEIRNDRSGHRLALPGGRTADGTFVLQWNCSANADQDWRTGAKS